MNNTTNEFFPDHLIYRVVEYEASHMGYGGTLTLGQEASSRYIQLLE